MPDMYFFKSLDPGLPITSLKIFGGSLAMDNEQQGSIFPALWGEEQSANMLSLLGILVLLLHIAGMRWLLQSTEQETPAKPLVMEVQMIAMAAPKPSVAPPAPVAPPPPEKKPPPVKSQAKPVPKKMPPVVQKPADFAPAESVAEPIAQSQPETQATAAPSSAATESKAPGTSG